MSRPLLSSDAIAELVDELTGLTHRFAPSPYLSRSPQLGPQDSVFQGSGVDYAESRPYQAGDELRHLHWRLMARTGEAYSKQFQTERQLPLVLWLDQSASMRFGSQVRLKVTQAMRLAATYAWQAQQLGLPLQACVWGETLSCSPIFEGREAWPQLMQFINRSCPPLTHSTGDLALALAESQPLLARHSRVVVISDWLAVSDATQARLAQWRGLFDCRVHGVRDPIEQKLGQPVRQQAIVWQDLNGQNLPSLNTQQQQDYQAWAAQQQRQVEQLLASLELDLRFFSPADNLMTLWQATL